MKGRILTGTASWADPGFVAHWYPKGLPVSQRLRWYAEHFSLVEVNSTFYRMPEVRAVARWCDETPEDFVFDLKLHRLLSRHSTPLRLLPQELRSKAVTRKDRVILTPALEKAAGKLFLRGIEPLVDAGKLGGLLLQLTPGFSPRAHQLTELDLLVEALAGYQLAIELRNAGWVEPENLEATQKYFESRELTFVMVDGPDDPHFTILPSVDLVTTPGLAYIRAHGRNTRGYIRGRSVADRFDYDYSRGELKEIAERAEHAADAAREVHVIYNNNKADYAPRAAAGFQKIVGVGHPKAVAARAGRREPVYA
jgi:uncharacterized protein YecE (DUF72 family)